jgi:signal transduction histidine kinase
MGENLAGSEVWVRITDNGRGIDPDDIDQIFDPFYTSREEGTGLGLAMCRKIVDNHGGSIEVESEVGEGTEFVLVFPKTKRSDSRKP